MSHKLSVPNQMRHRRTLPALRCQSQKLRCSFGRYRVSIVRQQPFARPTQYHFKQHPSL
jgi:hypothetical protein